MRAHYFQQGLCRYEGLAVTQDMSIILRPGKGRAGQSRAGQARAGQGLDCVTCYHTD